MSHQDWINGLSEDDRLSILDKHPRAIIHIKYPTFREIKCVMDIDVDALAANTNMCEAAQEYFISQYPDMIYIIKDPLPHILDIAIEKYPHAVVQVQNATNEQYIRAIELQPSVLRSLSEERLATIDDYVLNYAKLMR